MAEFYESREEILAWQDYLVGQVAWDEAHGRQVDRLLVSALATTAFRLIDKGYRGDGQMAEA